MREAVHMRNFFRYFAKDESGMGVVEVILIIVVLIGLVIIFQTQITKVVNNIFKTITSKTGKIK
jgi:Flp pilus assembly pilin Flp